MANLEQRPKNPGEENRREQPGSEERPPLWKPDTIESPSMEEIHRTAGEAEQGAEKETKEGVERVRGAGGTPEQIAQAEAAGDKRLAGTEQAIQKLNLTSLNANIEWLKNRMERARGQGLEQQFVHYEAELKDFERERDFKVKEVEFTGKYNELKSAIKGKEQAISRAATEEEKQRLIAEHAGLENQIRALGRKEDIRKEAAVALQKEEAPAATPPPERVPEAQLTQEAPPKELIGKESRNIFEKLTEGGKNLVRNLYERAKFRFVDRARIMFNGALLEHHNKGSARLVGRINEIDGAVKEHEGRLPDLNRRLAELREKYGPLKPEEELKFQKEREDYEDKLRAFKKERGEAAIKIERRNGKKALYETKRDRLCKEANHRIGERLKPFEGQMGGLQALKGKIDNELMAFWNERETFAAKVRELRERLGQAEFKPERRVLRRLLKEAQAHLEESNGYLTTRARERAHTESRLTRLEERSSHWREAAEELGRLTGRKPVYHKPPAEPKRAAPSVPEVRRPEAMKREPRFIPPKYAEAWNKFFGSEFQVDTKEFTRDYFPDAGMNFSFGALEGGLRRYYGSRAGRGKSRLKPKDLERHLGTLELFLNK